MADGRSVDVDESRDPTPSGGMSTPAVLASAGSRLSPIQQAYAAYVEHARGCGACRDIDRSCETADQLWRTYREQADGAYQQLADGAS